MALAVDLDQTFPRRFVPAGADMDRWEDIEPLFRLLQDAPPDSPARLERWLEDVSELMGAIDEERTRRYVAMTCQTDDPERERAFLAYIEDIIPKVKPFADALDRLYLGSPHRAALPARYRQLDRLIENRVALFRPENVPLETDEARLKQQYQKIAGAMSVTFRGKEHTLQQMARYMEEPDRALRQEAWELVARRRFQDRDAIEGIFDGLLALRERIGRHAGFADYRAYAFRHRERFDYTPDDCLRFHDAVETAVLPVLRRLHAGRRHALHLDRLRPWDLDVDPLGRPPLRPFSDGQQLITGVGEIFARVDKDLARQFVFMHERALLDLESRKGKAPGGYQSTMTERRVPFIFMNAVGLDEDLRTLLHEGGHAFHMFAARTDPIIEYREAPLEFCEVASMGMELLASRHLDVFYRRPEDARRSYGDMLERIVMLFAWVATVDAFQHWLYTHPGHTRDERRAAWLREFRRFMGDLDYAGYEEIEATLWHRQLHVFLYPFYYIEYGIAQIGALQVWRRTKADHAGAVRRYREALALGGRETLPALFAAAGAEFDFSARTLGPLMDEVAAAIQDGMS